MARFVNVSPLEIEISFENILCTQAFGHDFRLVSVGMNKVVIKGRIEDGWFAHRG